MATRKMPSRQFSERRSKRGYFFLFFHVFIVNSDFLRKKVEVRDLDSAMESINAQEERMHSSRNANENRSKTQIGTVEQFFDRLSVVAIKLSGDLKIGDIIEIGSEEDAIRQKVESMQINRKDVRDAHEGDSVGIKLKYKVSEGSSVYKM